MVCAITLPLPLSPLPSLPTARPEETVNEEEYDLRRKKEYAKTCAYIKEKLCTEISERSTTFEEFKIFASEYATDKSHQRAILEASTTNAVFCELLVGEYVTENDTQILQNLLKWHDIKTTTTERERLTQFELRRDFDKFSLKVADHVAERITVAQLKVCILSTPVQFGIYYSSLENERDTCIMIKILRDWAHPELLHRIVRHFYPEEKRWLDQYTEQMAAPASKETPDTSETRKAIDTYIDFREELAHLFVDISHHLQEHQQSTNAFLACVSSLPLSTVHPQLKLVRVTQPTVCDALLALAPFCSFHTTDLLSYIVNNYCDSTLHKSLVNHATKWEQFAQNTRILIVYGPQLDCFPLQLIQHNISTLILHVNIEQWRDPTLRQSTELARSTATAFNLHPWSVIAYRTVITVKESDDSGIGKAERVSVELLVPDMGACIIMKDGPGSSKLDFFRDNNITSLEVVVRDECYLSCELGSLQHMYKQALKTRYFAPYFEELNNVTECVH